MNLTTNIEKLEKEVSALAMLVHTCDNLALINSVLDTNLNRLEKKVQAINVRHRSNPYNTRLF